MSGLLAEQLVALTKGACAIVLPALEGAATALLLERRWSVGGVAANVTGTWHIVSSPDFDDGYLRMEVEPYVELAQSNNRVSGNYHVGLQQGEIDGRLESEGRVGFSILVVQFGVGRAGCGQSSVIPPSSSPVELY